jgi:hypothetical protein
MWRLVGIHGLYQGRFFDLSGERIYIGRSASSNIPLDLDESIGDTQLCLQLTDGAYTLTDLSSRCPTTVNGVTAGPAVALRGGDSIQVGDSVFRLEWSGPPPAATPLNEAPVHQAPTAPPRSSGLALASLILGCLSFVTAGLTALLGLILGVVGYRQISRSQGQLGGSGLATAGIAVSSVGIGFFLLIMAIAIPNFIRARDVSIARRCQRNIRQIDIAKQQWAMEKGVRDLEVTPSWEDISRYMTAQPVCPKHGSYAIMSMGELPTCSVGDNGTRSEYDDHALILRQQGQNP